MPLPSEDPGPQSSREFRIQESPEVPLLSVIFGWGPMIPFAIGAIAVWALQNDALAVRLTIIWGGAILAFLSGVRRGLSFRTPGGPAVQQIVTMLWLFLLALGALASPWPLISVILLLAGYGSIAILDPKAAERAEAPLFFARLRPTQMLVPILSLCAIGIRLLAS